MNYGNIISRAWKITFKYKWLWVYGMVLASLGGLGSGGGGGSSSGGSKNTPAFKDIQNITPPEGEELTHVLGTSTSLLKEWITHVPLEVWILLGVVFVFLVLYGIFVQIIIHSWATGALIGGLKDAEGDKNPVNLLTTTAHGKKTWKNIFLFNLLTAGVGLGLFVGSILVCGLGILIVGFLQIPFVQIILTVVCVLMFIFLLVISIPILTMISIYGERLIVLQGMETKEAFKKAFGLSKSSFWKTLIMGIIKNLITTGMGCASLLALLVIVGVPAAIIAVVEFKNGVHFPSAGSIVCWIILFLLFVYANLLVRGVTTVFSYSTWNLFFSEIIKGKEK